MDQYPRRLGRRAGQVHEVLVNGGLKSSSRWLVDRALLSTGWLGPLAMEKNMADDPAWDRAEAEALYNP